MLWEEILIPSLNAAPEVKLQQQQQNHPCRTDRLEPTQKLSNGNFGGTDRLDRK